MQLAAVQGGCFTSAQAQDLGYSHQGQKYHSDRGNWQRVGRGLYRLTGWPRGEHDELHRWSLWARGEGVVSHRSAALLHGLAAPRSSMIELIVPQGFRARAPTGLRLYRPGPRSGLRGLEEDEVEVVAGLRVTTAARTRSDLVADLEEGEPAEIHAGPAGRQDDWRQW